MTISHLDLARFCSQAYNAEHPFVWSISETDVLVRYFDDVAVLAVRGTEFSGAWPFVWSLEGLSNTRDVIRDLRFIPWRCPFSNTWVHKGFGISAHRWLNRYHSALSRKHRYIITGHSLGAAIAPQLARMMRMMAFEVDEVVVFGEPGGHYLGSRKHYASMGIPTTSYRTSNDWIRFAGYDRTVKRTILPAPGMSMPDSHDIDVYVEAMERLS